MHDKKHITCKMVQEEKNHALSSNQYLSSYSIQQIWNSDLCMTGKHIRSFNGAVLFTSC